MDENKRAKRLRYIAKQCGLTLQRAYVKPVHNRAQYKVCARGNPKDVEFTGNFTACESFLNDWMGYAGIQIGRTP